MYKRTPRKELSFAGEKVTRERHKIHPYPAMLHPLLVDFLIKEYAKKGDVILDPFCGSGVTLLQSSINGHKSIGFDINPLALLIAKVKTQKYNIGTLITEYGDFKNEVISSKTVDVPAIKNMDYWYSKDVINDLGRVRAVLKRKKYKYNEFFIIAFAFICRNQSLTRNGEFKRYRVKEEKIKTIENKVLEKLFEHIEMMINVVANARKPEEVSYPILANSENPIPSKYSYNIVITSPPYGDSRTTVAYGEYSSFGNEWIEDMNSYGNVKYKIDNESIGKVGHINEAIEKNDLLMQTIKKIAQEDEKRANDVLYFYNGYYNVIRNVIKNLKKDGRVCFVVGNRTVKGHQIPMDQITASFLAGLGLKFEKIYVRDILNKVMPSKNSPTNKTGVKKQTMMNEYIVIFHKN